MLGSANQSATGAGPFALLLRRRLTRLGFRLSRGGSLLFNWLSGWFLHTLKLLGRTHMLGTSWNGLGGWLSDHLDELLSAAFISTTLGLLNNNGCVVRHLFNGDVVLDHTSESVDFLLQTGDVVF